MASATAESNNSGYDTIVAGTGYKFRVVKDIPVIRPGPVQLPLQAGSIISVHASDYGGKKLIRFTIYLDGDDFTTAILDDKDQRKYLTTEYLEVIKTATTREGGRRKTRKYKRRHTKKRKQSRRRKN